MARVTKTTREYITQQVRMKAEESIANLKQMSDEATTNLNRDIEALKKKCEPFVQELRDKYPWCENLARIEMYGINSWNAPEYIDYHLAYQRAMAKAEQMALELIVEMELGGTMAELKKKLANLKF